MHDNGKPAVGELEKGLEILRRLECIVVELDELQWSIAAAQLCQTIDTIKSQITTIQAQANPTVTNSH